MSKPTSKPNWTDGAASKVSEPSESKKLQGWLKTEKPPFNFFNWLFYNISQWISFLGGQEQYNVIISSDTDEGDYTSLAAYIADSPQAGDRVLIKEDETLTSTLIIPTNIELTQLKGKSFDVVTFFTPIIQIGSNVTIKGNFRAGNSGIFTIAKGFSINGDNAHLANLIIENLSDGTITDGVYIESGAEGNYANVRSINSGGGSITNDLVDNSGNDQNQVTVIGDSSISRSNGAKKFDRPDIKDHTDAQHDHADAVAGGALASGITLDTPTIVDQSNAQHDHADAAGGGEVLGSFTATKITLSGSADSPPDTNTLVKDNIIKAWINFDGTGTIAIRDSYNVSSIVDNGVGDYTVNWDTDFANGNYACAGMSGSSANTFINWESQTVGTLQVHVSDADGAGTLTDVDQVQITAIGDQ